MADTAWHYRAPGLGVKPWVGWVALVPQGCIFRRMPRMQVYLPDDLYQAVKARKLPASELLQEAVRAEVRRQDLVEESRRYTAELSKQVGKPGAKERARAAKVARRIAGRRSQRQAS